MSRNAIRLLFLFALGVPVYGACVPVTLTYNAAQGNISITTPQNCEGGYLSGSTFSLDAEASGKNRFVRWAVAGCAPTSMTAKLMACTITGSSVQVTGFFARPPVRDLDGDGKADLLWQNSVTGQTAAWYLDGAVPKPGSGLTTLQFGNPAYRVVGFSDIMQTGIADIIWQHPTTGDVFIWEGEQSHPFSVGGFRPPNWSIKASTIFRPTSPSTYPSSDLLLRNSVTGETQIWFIQGFLSVSGDSGSIGGPPIDWAIAGVADFNGDGISDILWRDANLGLSSIWFMSGKTVLEGSGLTFLQIGSPWSVAAVGDFNNDSRADILWRNGQTGDNIIWLQNGLNTIAGSGPIAPVSDVNWNVVACADYNNDGTDDLLWRNDTNGETSVWMLNGADFAPGSGSFGVIPPPWKVVAPPPTVQ